MAELARLLRPRESLAYDSCSHAIVTEPEHTTTLPPASLETSSRRVLDLLPNDPPDVEFVHTRPVDSASHDPTVPLDGVEPLVTVARTQYDAPIPAVDGEYHRSELIVSAVVDPVPLTENVPFEFIVTDALLEDAGNAYRRYVPPNDTGPAIGPTASASIMIPLMSAHRRPRLPLSPS